MVRFSFGSPVGFVAMHLRFKITSVSMRVCVAVVFAIALAVACAAAFAQSPAAGAQSASVAPSASVPTAAASVAATAARPAAAASTAAVSVSAAPLPPDAKTVISYLSDVIDWYGHLGVEAQLVSEPDETLFFADDRQVASEVLRLAFEYARAQAAFLAKTSPNGAVAATGSTGTQPAATGAAGLGNTAQTLVSLEAAATTLRAESRICRRSWRKRRRARRAAIVSQIQALQSELDLNQARLDALKALTEFESGSAAPDQNSGLAAQIDELERSIADSSKKTTTLPVDTALVTSIRADRDSESHHRSVRAQQQARRAGREHRAGEGARSARGRRSQVDPRLHHEPRRARGRAGARRRRSRCCGAPGPQEVVRKTARGPQARSARRRLPLSKQIVLLGVYVNNVSAGTTRSNSAGTRNSAALSSA